MEYQEFKDKLINHCKAGGLSICKDNNGVFLTLSLSYTIFDFNVRNHYADTPGFKYRLSSCYPEKFSEKIVSFDEELLNECIKIADKWILKIKKKIINERKIDKKKAELEKDFIEDVVQEQEEKDSSDKPLPIHKRFAKNLLNVFKKDSK